MLFLAFNISVNHVNKNTLQCINYNKAFHSRLPFLLYGPNLNNLNDKKNSLYEKNLQFSYASATCDVMT